MRAGTWRSLTGLVALALLAACRGGSGGSGDSYGSDVRLTLQAQFEKRPLGPGGFGATITRPARYCWAEVRDANSQALLASGYLGSEGTGTVSVPKGLSVYLRVFADYHVPSADPNSFFMRGSVKNAPLPVDNTISSGAFDAIAEWSVTSATVPANTDGTLAVTALASNRIAGAFNIADQAVTFATAVRDMDGPTLRLPNLHTFWTTSTNPADQARTYPQLTLSTSGGFLVSNPGRAIFSHAVYGREGAANTETDEWDDGVLQETFARLLFAEYSYKADGSSSLSLLRLDNDNAWVDRAVQSESTVAFVAGFSDFLSAAARNDSRILDSYVDSAGAARVDAYDLTDHAYVPSANKGEFTRGSIAVSLWGLWKNVLGGGSSGLNTLWAAVRSTTPIANGTGEYEQATLGCFPTYLQGVASRVSATTWNAALIELAREAVPNPDANYFLGTALWQTRGIPMNVSGDLQTYASGYIYDRNQSQAWRFTHGGGARTITMTPTSGQDFYLELIGPGGWVDRSYNNAGSTRTLSFTNLPAGVYVARVRASYENTITGLNSYTINVN